MKMDDLGAKDDLLETAWGVIANALGWDDPARAEWRAAAERWRDAYHQQLPVASAEPAVSDNHDYMGHDPNKIAEAALSEESS